MAGQFCFVVHRIPLFGAESYAQAKGAPLFKKRQDGSSYVTGIQ